MASKQKSGHRFEAVAGPRGRSTCDLCTKSWFCTVIVDDYQGPSLTLIGNVFEFYTFCAETPAMYF